MSKATINGFNAYPNPFNSATIIKYSITKNAEVELKIYNLLGRKVVTLVDGYKLAGYQSVRWQPEKTLGSGIYFVRVSAGDRVVSKKILLLK
ncbi:T9SS type A sorting domain-containing protein [bacterium]|nr:T9SS type A sorting domain-containing protein [bacterium]